MIKLIAIDMDGTLLNEHHLVTDKVKKAIKEASDAGIKIVLCTGRPVQAVYEYLKELEMPQDEEDYVISLNGTVVQKTTTWEIVYSHELDHKHLVAAEQLSRSFEMNFTYFDENNYYYTGEPTEMMRYDVNLLGMEAKHLPIKEIPKEMKVFKAMYVAEATELDRLSASLPSFISENFYPIRSLSYVLELLPQKANKGEALTGLAEKLGFSMDEVMAIGDGENDLDMMKVAGTSIAMGNAVDSIMESATHVTKSNQEDGVAHAIYEWALKW
ncbi:MAG: Cof-type HAD-IIB family hydrolase [Carnobacterium alterfunditum]